MPEIQANEREFNSQVIAWLNEFVSTGSYPFENITGETSVKAVGETTKFPDVQVWLSRSAKQGFCGWELKPPSIPADDPTLLGNAADKARAMNADYFVTWNMRSAILWRTPQALMPVFAESRVKEYPPIPNINQPEDMWVKSNEIRLKERAREILDDLKTIKYEGHLHEIEADTTFFVGRLHKSVDVLFPHLRDALLNSIGGEFKFKKELQTWGTKQGIANVTDAEFHQAVAKQIIYRLLVRILFYFTLQRQWRNLPELSISGLSGQAASAHLKDIFAQARDLDWHAVFEEGLADEIELPDAAIQEIGSLLNDLKRFSFSHMPHDVIGAVFEKLIPQTERHTLGQYFTPENLVDFVLAFCIRQRDDKVVDPTCGTGTFLLRAYNKKMRHLGLVDHKQLLPQIWGVDIAHFPAELATINLFRQNLSDYANFPRIIVKDLFDIKPGDTFDFPPPKADLSSGFTKIKETIPQFDAAVGNFPFIRQELIEKTEKGYKDKLENVIKTDWLADYREAFDIKEQDWKAFKKGIKVALGDINFNLSGQADIYAYLFFHAGRFVKEGGRMGFITSNSWLDVAYGYELQKYMVNNFKIVAILESRCEPWFEDAAVNTVVTILERCSDKKKRDEHIASFVKVKKRLADLIPWDAKLEASNRWVGLDGLIHKIENAADKNCYVIDGPSVKCTLEGVFTVEDHDFRIRLVKQSELRDKLNAESKTAKWGQYLRAPQVFFDCLNEFTEQFTPLNKFAEVQTGCYTGINEFFYVEADKVKHWNLSETYLIPVIRSPKETPNVAIDVSKLKTRLLLCKDDKSTLKATGHMNLLKYIEWGERQVTKAKQKVVAGIPWPKVPTVINRKPGWWAIPRCNPSQVFLSYVIGDVYSQRYCEQSVVSDRCFHMVLSHDKTKNILLAAILNSSIVSLMIEMAGRVNLGEGALKFETDDAKSLLIPNLQLFMKPKPIVSCFQALSKRPVKSIFEEVKMKDRQKLDSLVLEAMGLDPAKYLRPIYDGLTELVRERTELAGMRTKLNKAKPVRDMAKMTQQVTNDLLQEGIKKFPDDFMSKKLKPQDYTNIGVPDVPLRLGNYFMGQQEVVGEGFSYEASNIAAAKYIIYARKPNEYVVCLPKAELVVTKAVANYECYLKELFQKLNQNLLNRTFDHKQSETLSRRIFQEFGLPSNGI
ncbi:MAG: N-6 DNA methylase [Dehalococcoidales bacterium]|nr:N-6 DNA methylase [Dehalococcoidales bacterium]